MEVFIGCIVTVRRKVAGKEHSENYRITTAAQKMATGKVYYGAVSLSSKNKVTLFKDEIVFSETQPDSLQRNQLQQALTKVMKEKRSQLLEVIERCKVEIRWLDNKKTMSYELVGKDATDRSSGKLGITDNHLGRSLVGKAVDEVFKVNDRDVIVLKVDAVTPAFSSEVPAKNDVNMPLQIASIEDIDLGEKKEVVQLDPHQSSMVMAGPGCGKSFTLVQRVAYLIEHYSLNPNVLLVLSFSREAVAEVRRRLSEYTIRNIQYVHPITIDSYAATIILKNQNPKSPFPWGDKTYDDAIIEATRLLERRDIAEIRHLFVDEVQDIVGCRAEFVQKIINMLPNASAGITLLGDLNQSIYNWSLKEQAKQITSDQFLANIKLATCMKIREFELSKNWRTSNSSIKDLHTPVLAIMQKALTATSNELVGLKNHFQEILSTYSFVRSRNQDKYAAKGEVHPEVGKQKCILTRDNGQLIGEKEKNIPRDIAIRVLGKYMYGQLPVYVAKLFAEHCHDKILSRDQITQFANEFQLETKDGWKIEEVWDLLKGIEKDNRWPDYLDLGLTKKRLVAIRDVPFCKKEKDELSRAPIVLSTIHCSKGLEFDEVFIIAPELDRIHDLPALIDELRLFYVAITRAKSLVRLLDERSIYRLYPHYNNNDEDAISRWYRKTDDGRIEFNIDNDLDVDGASFITEFQKADVTSVQAHILERLKVGDIVQVKHEDYVNGARYFIYHENLCIGCMSASFYKSIDTLYTKNRRQKPNRFDAKVGKLYSEHRFYPFSLDILNKRYTNEIEAWAAIKLTGLSKG